MPNGNWNDIQKSYQVTAQLLLDAGRFFAEIESPLSAEVERARQKFAAGVFNLAIVATTSTGKSTLVNAMIGLEILPMSNEAKTAFCSRVIPINQGQPACSIVYSNNDIKALTLDLTATKRVMAEIDNYMKPENSSNIKELKVEIPVEAFRPHIAANLPDVHIIDTPGPTTAHRQDHKLQTLKAIADFNAVIYVFDYTKDFQTSDDELLSQLKASWQKLNKLQHSSKKMFFVINKVDVRDRHEKEIPEDRIEKVHTRLKEIFGTDNVRRPFAISAAQALLARLSLKGQIQGEDAEFDYHNSLTNARHWHKDLIGPHPDPDQFLLACSGLPSVEREIYHYLVQTSAIVLALDALNEVQTFINQEKKNHRLHISLWKSAIDNLEVRIQQSIARIKTFETRFAALHQKKSREGASAAAVEIKKEIDGYLQALDVVISDSKIKHIEIGGIMKALTQDIKDIWTRLQSDKKEEFASMEAAKNFQLQVVNDLGQALTSKQAYIIQEVDSMLKKLAFQHNRDYHQNVEALARQVEQELAQKLNIPIELDACEVVIPAAPTLQSLDLEDIGISQESTKRIREKTVTYKPWYYLWLIELSKKVTVSESEEIFCVSINELFRGLQEEYKRQIRHWQEDTLQLFTEKYLIPTAEHYRLTSDAYLNLLQSQLTEHQKDRERHLNQEERITMLENHLEKFEAFGQKMTTLLGNLKPPE
jgi:hypothetical protein